MYPTSDSNVYHSIAANLTTVTWKYTCVMTCGFSMFFQHYDFISAFILRPVRNFSSSPRLGILGSMLDQTHGSLKNASLWRIEMQLYLEKLKHFVLMWVHSDAFMICINYIISSRFPTPQTNGLGFAPLIFGMLQVLALQRHYRGEHCPISKPKATEPQGILTAGSIII